MKRKAYIAPNGETRYVRPRNLVTAGWNIPCPSDEQLLAAGWNIMEEEIAPYQPTEEEQKQQRIDELKGLLASTDYEAIKFAEGEMNAEDYAPYRAQRRAWREEINQLEEE